MEETIDVRIKAAYPGDVLSNFYDNEFVYDGVYCASMEGFLQSLKYRQPDKQTEVCRMTGFTAKSAGARKKLWKLTGRLYWKGKKLKRNSEVFDGIISDAFDCLSCNAKFAEALKSTAGKTLTHTVGKHKKRFTVLTAEEFVFHLNRLREKLLSEEGK